MPRWWPPANSKAGSAGAPTRCAKELVAKAEPAPPPRRPGTGRSQSAGTAARPARAVETGRPGRRPSHTALWKRFDEACNQAHKVVEAWLEKVRADAAEHRAQRLALIEELKAWAAAHADDDLKSRNRSLRQFADRWRDAGVSEKVFAELQPQWNRPWPPPAAARAAQKASVERRQQMIAEATELGAAPQCAPSRRAAALAGRGAGGAAGASPRAEAGGTRSASRSTTPSSARRLTASVPPRRWANTTAPCSRLPRRSRSPTAPGAQKIRAAMSRTRTAQPARHPVGPGFQANPAAAPDRPAQGAGVVAPGQAAAEFSESATQRRRRLRTPAAPAPAAAPAGWWRPPMAPIRRPPTPRSPQRPPHRQRHPSRHRVPWSPCAATTGPVPSARPPPRCRAAVQRPARRARRSGRAWQRPRRPAQPRPPWRRRPLRRRPGWPLRGLRPPREDRGPRLGDTCAFAPSVTRSRAPRPPCASWRRRRRAKSSPNCWVPGNNDGAALLTRRTWGAACRRRSPFTWAQAISGAPGGDAGEALLRLEMAADVPTPADQLDAARCSSSC